MRVFFGCRFDRRRAGFFDGFQRGAGGKAGGD